MPSTSTSYFVSRAVMSRSVMLSYVFISLFFFNQVPFVQCETEPKNGTVIITMVSRHYVPIYRIWCSRMQKLSLDNYIAIAQDETAYMEIKEIDPQHVMVGYDLEVTGTSSDNGKSSRYGNEAWKKSIEKKASYVTMFLFKNKTVLYTDVDVIFLRNPISYLEAHTTSISMSYGVDTVSKQNFNSGFIHCKPTEVTKHVMLLWKHLSREIHNYKAPPYDQRALNDALIQSNIKYPHIYELPSRLFQYYPDCKALTSKCRDPFVIHFTGRATPSDKLSAIQSMLASKKVPY